MSDSTNTLTPEYPATETDPKIAALAKHLDIKIDEITVTRWGAYEVGNCEYLVYTDSEADEYALDDAKQALWAFNVSFLAGYCPALQGTRVAEAIQKIQGELCEDAGPVFAALLGDNLNRAMRDAISADGRGPFLSSYDGEENESTIDGVTYYIYRTN